MPARHRAKKSLSQHFLVDPNLQRKVVEALEPAPGDHVLEIGPGTGSLTRHLVGRVDRLILVELDDALAGRLAEEYAGREDVSVVHADALDVRLEEVSGGRALKVVGNIPYAITTPLIFHLLEARPRPRMIVLTVQREVADRLTARPGTKEYGALTVGVQAVARVEPLFGLSRGAFRPRPEVESRAVRIVPLEPPPLAPGEEESLRRLTRVAFSRRRKQMQKVLRQAPEYRLSVEEADALFRRLALDPSVRPDALPVADYIRLAAALADAG
jgi:16S rRNA (adenine1518-N6/adenine1519-N6)-dimethyltransferase